MVVVVEETKGDPAFPTGLSLQSPNTIKLKSQHQKNSTWPTLVNSLHGTLCCMLCAHEGIILLIFKGFFKGTSADQDRRFSDKEEKLVKSMKFPPEFSTKVCDKFWKYTGYVLTRIRWTCARSILLF